MIWLKKYAAITILLSIFPASWFIGRAFVTEYGTDIYGYIPQESDIVIEVNNINFISEFAYQRIYNEDYVMEKIDFEEVETETGIDYFSKIVIFRERWAEEDAWFAVMGYKDKELFADYIRQNFNDKHVAFDKEYAILQLSNSENQEKMDVRLQQIANQDIKPFSARVDLNKYFKTDKEINCYFIPPSTAYDNSIIDGYMTFDFKQDHVDIDGEFNPVSGFENTPGIAYAIDEQQAFSMRSSLNVFNSIYWFSKEKIENVPEYSQMAFDYNGVNMRMVDDSFGYTFPFKKFPEMEVRFDLVGPDQWQEFFDTLLSQEKIRIDTTVGSLVTSEGTFFKYTLNDEVFELYGKSIGFEPSGETDVCFDMQFKIADLIDNTKLGVDKDNPPGPMKQFGLALIEDMIQDMHVLDNVEQIKFSLIKNGDNKLNAKGTVQMHNREGQSVIEGFLFAKESIIFLSDALSVVTDLDAISQ